MKTLKKLTTLALSFVLALGCCALTACGGGKTYDAYEFVVKNADGSKVTEGFVQLCEVKDDGSLGVCYNPAPIENGKVVYDEDFQGNTIPITEPGIYEVHVLSNNAGYPGSQVELAEVYETSADSFGEYTIVLK